MLPTFSAPPRAATYSFHGNCQTCKHWHKKIPLTIPDPSKYVDVCCVNCHNRMFGIGGNSTHASLVSQETIPRSWTFASDDLPEHVVSERRFGDSLDQLQAAGPALLVRVESHDTQTIEDENPGMSPTSRPENSPLSPQSPSPGLLSPTSMTPKDRPRERSHSAPPPLANEKQSYTPRRVASFKEAAKKVVKKAANRFGYDFVPINTSVSANLEPTPQIAFEDSPPSASPRMPSSERLDTLVNPSEVPLPRSPDITSEPTDVQMPVHEHRSNRQPLSNEDIKRIRRLKTLQALTSATCQCEGDCICVPQSLHSVAPPTSSADEVPSPFDRSARPQYTTMSSSDGTLESLSTSEAPRSAIEYATIARREFGRHRSRAPQAIQSLESLASRSVSNDRLNAPNRNSGDRMSTVTTVLDPSESGSTTELIPTISPHVPLPFPYPPLRISTDLTNMSDNSERHVQNQHPEDDANEQDGDGLTPIAAGGRRSSIMYDPVTPEDIHNDEHWRSRNSNRESRASVDAASVTSTHGSAQYQDGEE